MRRFALPAAILLAASLSGQAAEFVAPARFRITDGRQHGMAALYAAAPGVAASYATAMMRYQAAALREDFLGLAYPLVLSYRPLAEGPWTWTAPDGSTIRRLQNGAFRITFSNQPGNWFFHYDCSPLRWPLFTCDDGREREMSAPDLGTIVFEGKEYKRELPEMEKAAPETPPLEDASLAAEPAAAEEDIAD